MTATPPAPTAALPGQPAPPALAHLNALDPAIAAAELLPCCASQRWAAALAAARPFPSLADLIDTSDRVWPTLSASDLAEAFAAHPRIGEQHPQAPATSAASLTHSAHEQSRTALADANTQAQLRAGNLAYEVRFGHIFLIRAAGRSAEEILAELRRRLSNTPTDELREAAEQQRQITRLRLQRWAEAPLA